MCLWNGLGYDFLNLRSKVKCLKITWMPLPAALWVLAQNTGWEVKNEGIPVGIECLENASGSIYMCIWLTECCLRDQQTSALFCSTCKVFSQTFSSSGLISNLNISSTLKNRTQNSGDHWHLSLWDCNIVGSHWHVWF